MSIGTLENAKAALSGGHHWIGRGSSRTCYLIDGVVYKVENYSDYSNRNEVRCADIYRERIAEAPFPFAIPEVTGYQVDDDNYVVAMQFVDGEPARPWNCAFPQAARMWLENRLGYDCGGENVVIADGWYWLIDMDGFPEDC